jgi:hypothetical protein
MVQAGPILLIACVCVCVCVFLGCGRAKTRPASGWSCASTSCTSSKRLSVCKVGFHWTTKGSTFCCIRPKWVCCQLFLGFSHWEEQLFTFPGNSQSWIRERRIHYLDIYLRAILQGKKKASKVGFYEQQVALFNSGFWICWKPSCAYKMWICELLKMVYFQGVVFSIRQVLAATES